MKLLRMGWQWSVAFLIIWQVTACATRPGGISDSALDATDRFGLLMITANRNWTEKRDSDPPLLELLYRPAEGPIFVMKTATFGAHNDLVLQKLPPGRYTIYNSFVAFSHMKLPEITIEIRPGEITYAGTFSVDVKYPKLGLLTTRQLNVTNELDAAKVRLAEGYPNIAKLYPIRTEVTQFSLRD